MNQLNAVMLPNTTSYGKTAINVLRQLDKHGIEVSLFPIDIRGIEVANQEDYNLVQKMLVNSRRFNGNAPTVRLWHAFDMGLRAGKGKSFGWTIFELDRFTTDEIFHLNSMDELICCSNWAKQVCQDNKINIPVHVVPLGVDRSIYHENHSKNYLKRKYDDSFVFINIGKMEFRKHDIILNCFEKAFDSGQNVELHMIWKNRLLDQRNPKESTGWEKYYKNSQLSNRITLYDWLPSEVEVAQVLCGADCGIFPSHAEGFNFGLLEALSAGLQVITTNYSAHTEYCDNNNSLLINIDELELAHDGIWFDRNNGGRWAKLDKSQEEQTVAYMRSLYERKMNGDDLFNSAGVETARQFTWENTFNKLENILG